MRDVDRKVGRLAAGQLSLVTRSQLLKAGLTAPQIDYRVRGRSLLLVQPDVYRMPGGRATYESEVLAACLATGGVASHRCAARLFGLRGFDRSKVVDIAVDGRRAPRLPGVVGHRLKGLERTRIGVIPVAVPAEVLLGVAAVAPRLAEGAVNDALVRHLVSLPALVRFLNGGQLGAGTASGCSGRSSRSRSGPVVRPRAGWRTGWSSSCAPRSVRMLDGGIGCSSPVDGSDLTSPGLN